MIIVLKGGLCHLEIYSLILAGEMILMIRMITSVTYRWKEGTGGGDRV